MTDLNLIVGSACLSLLIIHVIGLPMYVKSWIWKKDYQKHRLKPLDCEHCLAFWICVILSFFLQKNWVEVICISAIASIMAIFLTKYLNK